jgi:hypothetical protein
MTSRTYRQPSAAATLAATVGDSSRAGTTTSMTGDTGDVYPSVRV